MRGEVGPQAARARLILFTLVAALLVSGCASDAGNEGVRPSANKRAASRRQPRPSSRSRQRRSRARAASGKPREQSPHAKRRQPSSSAATRTSRFGPRRPPAGSRRTSSTRSSWTERRSSPQSALQPGESAALPAGVQDQRLREGPVRRERRWRGPLRPRRDARLRRRASRSICPYARRRVRFRSR